MVSWDCGANLSGMALSSWTGSQSSRLRPLCLHTAVPLWTAGCVGSCDRIETGLVLCPHESLCHLHVSPSGRTVISGTVLLVSYIPCPYMVPECPSPVTTRPRPHVATTDRSLSREKKVEGLSGTGWPQDPHRLAGCSESWGSCGPRRGPLGHQAGPEVQVTPGAPNTSTMEKAGGSAARAPGA